MQKVVDFRRRAKDLRDTAAKAKGNLKQQYEELATAWDRLAADRLAFFIDHPEADLHGEVDGDSAEDNDAPSAG